MTHKDIPIPGGTTNSEDSPEVRIIHISEHPLALIIKYISQSTKKGEPRIFGEITFSNVLEYRWIESEYIYFPFPEENDYERGLIEILNSKHIENMASKGYQKKLSGKPFGPFVKESDVHHYRLAFPEYGYFDIIALGISMKEISEP
jgi:hypothetical protein